MRRRVDFVDGFVVATCLAVSLALLAVMLQSAS